MSLNTPYSPGDTIKSSNTNQDLDGLADGSNDTESNSLQTFRKEAFDNFFADGCKWSISSGMVASMSSGILYFGGDRIEVSAVGSHTFTENQDTYVDISNSGSVTYQTVSNNDTPPVVAPNYIRNAVIVTDATGIQTIIQKDRDSGGNVVYNDSPIVKQSNAPRVKNITSDTTVTPDSANTDVVVITALANDLEIKLPAGQPANAQALLFRIKDNGTVRNITWNSVYRAIGVTMPIQTVASKTLYVGAMYNQEDARWDILSVGRE